MRWPEPRFVGLRGRGRVRDAGRVCEGVFVGVGGCEGDVVRWVPVFGADLDREGEVEEGVDGGDYITAVGDGEGTCLWEKVRRCWE